MPSVASHSANLPADKRTVRIEIARNGKVLWYDLTPEGVTYVLGTFCYLCLRSVHMRKLERAKGFEPSTPTLARLCSTPELRPRSGRRRADHTERTAICNPTAG